MGCVQPLPVVSHLFLLILAPGPPLGGARCVLCYLLLGEQPLCLHEWQRQDLEKIS